MDLRERTGEDRVIALRKMVREEEVDLVTLRVAGTVLEFARSIVRARCSMRVASFRSRPRSMVSPAFRSMLVRTPSGRAMRTSREPTLTVRTLTSAVGTARPVARSMRLRLGEAERGRVADRGSLRSSSLHLRARRAMLSAVKSFQATQVA